MIRLEAGQVWRASKQEASSRRIISLIEASTGLMVEYAEGDDTVTEIGTSFRRWIDVHRAVLVEEGDDG